MVVQGKRLRSDLVLCIAGFMRILDGVWGITDLSRRMREY